MKTTLRCSENQSTFLALGLRRWDSGHPFAADLLGQWGALISCEMLLNRHKYWLPKVEMLVDDLCFNKLVSTDAVAAVRTLTWLC